MAIATTEAFEKTVEGDEKKKGAVGSELGGKRYKRLFQTDRGRPQEMPARRRAIAAAASRARTGQARLKPFRAR